MDSYRSGETGNLPHATSQHRRQSVPAGTDLFSLPQHDDCMDTTTTELSIAKQHGNKESTSLLGRDMSNIDYDC